MKCCKTDQVCQIDIFHSFFKQDIAKEYEGESHDFWEIVCAIDGEFGVVAGNEIYVLEKGQAVIHPPMEFHNLWSRSENTEMIIFSFEGKMPNFTGKIFQMSEKDIEEIKQIYREMQKNYDFEDGNIWVTGIKKERSLQACCSAKKLEIFIMTLLSNENKMRSFSLSKSAQYYTKAVSLLEENLEKNLSSSDIAEMCSMSLSNLKKVFKKYSGMGIMNYYNTLKINKAKEMLENGFSIDEISEKLAFSDRNYFSVVFKRITGVAPSKYLK